MVKNGTGGDYISQQGTNWILEDLQTGDELIREEYSEDGYTSPEEGIKFRTKG